MQVGTSIKASAPKRRRMKTTRSGSKTLGRLHRERETLLRQLQRIELTLQQRTERQLNARLKHILEHSSSADFVDADVFAAQLAGGRIAFARKARGWTQQRLATAVKMPQSQIARLERHPEKTTVKTLKRVAAALGVNVQSLLGPG